MGLPSQAGAAPPWPAGTPWGPSPWGPAPGVSPQVRDTDLAALGHLKKGAIIALVGTALGFTFPLIASFLGYSPFTFAFGSTAGLSTLLTFVLAAALVGMALTVVSLWFMREGFSRIRTVDARFSSSPTWVLLAMIGIIMVAIGLGLLLSELVSLLSCIGTSPTPPSSCFGSLTSVLAGGALAGIGGLLFVIGGIGTVVAVWRLGTRYNESLFKVGAILYIFFQIVGAILVLLAVMRAEKAVQSAPALAFAPTPPPPPFSQMPPP
jgi:putative flippase GtrA